MHQISNLMMIMATMNMNFTRNLTEGFSLEADRPDFQDRAGVFQAEDFQGKAEEFRAVVFLEADQVGSRVVASREAEHRHRRHLNSLHRKRKHPCSPLTRAELGDACIAIRISG